MGVCIYLSVHLPIHLIFFQPHSGSSHVPWPPTRMSHFGDHCSRLCVCHPPLIHVLPYSVWDHSRHWGHHSEQENKDRVSTELTIQWVKQCLIMADSVTATKKIKQGDVTESDGE